MSAERVLGLLARLEAAISELESRLVKAEQERDEALAAADAAKDVTP